MDTEFRALKFVVNVFFMTCAHSLNVKSKVPSFHRIYLKGEGYMFSIGGQLIDLLLLLHFRPNVP